MKKSLTTTSSQPFDEFCDKYAFYIPESHKNFFSSADLQRFLHARYDFFHSHTDEVKIAVHNPSNEFLWLSNASVIEVLMPDSPFIVDTLVDYCNARNCNIQLLIHPILNVIRDQDGQLQRLHFPGEAGMAESYVYLEITRLPDDELSTLKREIETNLKELRGVVTDYQRMLPLLEALKFEDEQVAEDLEWLKENFVLLGLVALEEQELNGRHLGLFKKAAIRQGISNELNSFPGPHDEELIIYRETDIHSNVNKHRQIYIAIVQNRQATYVLAGHFRHRAQLALRYSIPMVRRMIDEMATELRVPDTSYMRKELYKAAQSLPVGLLLTRSKDFLFRWFVKIISNMYALEVNYDISIDEEYGQVWAEVILPLSDAGKIPGRMMKTFTRKYNVHHLSTHKYQLNQVETVFLAFRSSSYSLLELKSLLEANAHDLFSTWSSRFRELVFEKYAGDRIDDTLARYANGMSPDYEVHQEPEEALRDLDILENMQLQDGYRADYYAQKGSDEDLIKIYTCQPTKLSELVPILTDFGFIVNREYTFPYRPDEHEKFTYAFSVPRDHALKTADHRRIAMGVAGVLNEETTSKPINALMRVGSIALRQLELVKALCGYYYKIQTSHTFSSIQRCLVKYPDFTSRLVHLFEVKFTPESKEREMRKARQAMARSFQALDSIVEENICRDLLNIVNAIVRTNYFLDKSEITFKLDSGRIDNLPKPVPYREIYVYGYDMEGIHLRGGPVARGGIRWSDRQDDFRTEILGLVKAQQVKNTVIVPVGSKGGFVVKNREFSERQALLAAGVEAYKRYISCLLELTDNLSASGKVIPAPNIKRLDGDDTYLVVAADKGTATFSDLANEISNEHKFWLSDAFASGGSNGYDHKKQGITAKGAWESVKRHFHEMEVNPEREVITLVGIGDMAGDVFGNGLLCSRTLKLRAAFNHMYIFLDPNPDPEASYKERERLFREFGNWDAYDANVISKGGGVFSRDSRKIEISPEVRDALGIKVKSLSGEALIKAILRAPVDLIWNGGIGTYVKASHESHYQAGDPANDRVRIDATELRARVIGEGGNLGLTQAARIEAASRGVRLNTDAIDNSGGVNMSDHEVNLKILLNNLLQRKKITEKQRKDIIRKYEPAMIDLVLAQNYKNNLGLSLDMRRTSAQFIYIRSLIQFLNRKGIIDRAQDGIPFETDLDELEHGSRTLPRPILCALVGFGKLFGAQMLLESDEFTDPWYDHFILRYFPAGLSKKYEREIKNHPLKREIVITEAINEIVNHAGLAFLQRMYMATQKSPVQVAVAYLRLSEFLDLPDLRTAIETPGEWLNAKLHYEYLLHLEEKVYQITKKLLLNPELLKTIEQKESGQFQKMLQEAAEFSAYRLPRNLRSLVKSWDDETGERIRTAFRQVDILEDTFTIYVHNKSNRQKWQVKDYFTVVQHYRIKELRQILKDLKASSSWEVSFFSKVDAAIDDLVVNLLQTHTAAGQQSMNGARQKLRSVIHDILEMHTRSELSVATFYEMVQYLNMRI